MRNEKTHLKIVVSQSDEIAVLQIHIKIDQMVLAVETWHALRRKAGDFSNSIRFWQ